MHCLHNAAPRKLAMLDGGANPTGVPCKSMHSMHSMHQPAFVGMEKEAVALMTDWSKPPSN
jgi:hypothetical protein